MFRIAVAVKVKVPLCLVMLKFKFCILEMSYDSVTKFYAETVILVLRREHISIVFYHINTHNNIRIDMVYKKRAFCVVNDPQWAHNLCGCTSLVYFCVEFRQKELVNNF